MKQNIGIIGLGQVGTALKDFIGNRHNVYIRELKYDQIGDQSIKYLHICIPFSSQFTHIASSAIKEINPKLTLIHTTCQPGSTRQIYKNTQKPIVHTPFVGIHPPDKSSLPSMDSYFASTPIIVGPTSKSSLKLAQNYLKSLGAKITVFDRAFESELAKILSTTYYAWNILFEKWVHQTCQEYNANFDQVYTKFNLHYNDTYKHILPQVIRPTLTHQTGTIGGHCLIPNAQIIQDWLGDDFTQFLLKQNKKLTK